MVFEEDYLLTFAPWESKLRQADTAFRLPDLGVILSIETVCKRLNQFSHELARVQITAEDK